MHQAYTSFLIKSVDEEERIIIGIASTPSEDRGGDEMDPKGAVFTLPMPFRWKHKTDIGEVFAADVQPAGIQIKARIAKVDEPGILKDELDYAWHSLKARLARGLSIGWTPLEATRKSNGGLKVARWNWVETSAVSIPMNAEATILAIKAAFDTDRPAAVGDTVVVLSETKPAVAGTVRSVKLSNRQGSSMKKPIADQIRDLEATRAAKSAEREAILEKSADTGETMDTEQTETYDGLTAEIKSIDADLTRWRDLEKEHKAKALQLSEVSGKSQDDAAASRAGRTSIQVKDTMPPDVAFGAMVLCKAYSFLEFQKGNFVTPLDVARSRYPNSKIIHDYLQAKTAVIGGTTTDTNFAASLLAPAQVLESAFLEYLRPLTIVDRFGTTQNGVSIPSLRRVPFNVKIQSQTTGASAAWVGEGKGKPVTKFHTTDTTLLFNKIAAIAVITDELARFSRPGAEGLVRDELAKAVVERMDTDFVDPAKAVSSGVNPASITNGLTALTSAGTSAANVLTDVQSLVAPFLRLNYSVRSLVLLMPDTLALTLSLMQNSLGQDSFQGMTVNGGTLAGLPVLTSNYLASGASFGNMVVCLSAENIALADDGNVSVDASREASIQMEDVSTMDATAGTGQTSVSMFQTNSIAIRAEREITWKKLRSTAVVYMDDVNWGSIGSPV